MVERLFGLRRRRAIELMHLFGGYQAGRTFLLDRLRLLATLKQLQNDPAFAVEVRRQERLGDVLDRLRNEYAGTQVRIPVPPDVLSRKVPELSPGIDLQRGRLQIEFAGAEDLLAKLYELARAAANDFERFRQTVQLSG